MIVQREVTNSPAIPQNDEFVEEAYVRSRLSARSLPSKIIEHYSATLGRWRLQDFIFGLLCLVPAFFLLKDLTGIAKYSLSVKTQNDITMGLVFFTITGLIFITQALRDSAVLRNAEFIDSIEHDKRHKRMFLTDRSDAH